MLHISPPSAGIFAAGWAVWQRQPENRIHPLSFTPTLFVFKTEELFALILF